MPGSFCQIPLGEPPSLISLTSFQLSNLTVVLTAFLSCPQKRPVCFTMGIAHPLGCWIALCTVIFCHDDLHLLILDANHRDSIHLLLLALPVFPVTNLFLAARSFLLTMSTTSDLSPLGALTGPGMLPTSSRRCINGSGGSDRISVQWLMRPCWVHLQSTPQ